MEQFNLHEWKLRELQKYNNITNGRHTFRPTAQTYNSPEQRHTLVDGTVIITPEGDNWIGKPITLEDGTSLPPGEYELAGGRDSSRLIVIGKDGNVKEVREPAMTAAIKNSFTPMDRGRFDIERYKRDALSRMNGNGTHSHTVNINAMPQTLTPKRRIQLLEAKIEELRKFLKK